MPTPRWMPIGFYLRADPQHIHLLGGNQLEQVREHFYPASTVLGYRWPTELHRL